MPDSKYLGREIVAYRQIQEKIRELGNLISLDYSGKNPVIIGVLKGAFVFMSDLIKHISIDVSVDFISICSYAGASKSSGVLRLLKDLDFDILGQDVILVEDIIDSGLTISYLKKNLLLRKPKSLALCVLLVKDGTQKLPIEIDYCGFVIPSKFVVGYGLDYNESYRNLTSIYELRDKKESDVG